MELTDHIGKKSQHDSDSDHADLWQAWHASGDPSVREMLIQAYLPFARMLAAKMFGKRTYMELEFHDYFQHASIGLIEAVDRFDLAKRVKFEAYAASRINGAILSGIETLSEKQEQVSARKRVIASRVTSLKEQSRKQEETEVLFASLAELAIGLATGLMLEDSGMYQDDTEVGFDSTYQGIELRQLQKRVAEAVQSLKENERRVIYYHYFQQIAFEEIAKILELSKGRISQLHKEALVKLHANVNVGGMDLFF